jgi:hypothetical protein
MLMHNIIAIATNESNHLVKIIVIECLKHFVKVI